MRSDSSARDVEIVEASGAEDLAHARRLLLEYAESFGWDLDSSSSFADEIEHLPGAYAPPVGSLLLAKADGEAVGVLGLQPIPEDARTPGLAAEHFGELKRLYVSPEQRQRGIGRALMARAESVARTRGLDALVLTTSADLMPLAQRLYNELGYCPTEPYRTDLPWPDIRWLKLDL